ncbi:MAG: hypothetical protein R3304_13395, partial [Longimicrobiales bacterium]|nr:hypothetical protein [Longimicrobiales bacterium]
MLSSPRPALLILIACQIAFAGSATVARAQMAIAEPFKVGTFEIEGMPRVALVFRDAHVVEIERANRDIERIDLYPTVPPPEDMLDLIARYEYGMKQRLYEITNHLVENDMITGDRPDYVYDLEEVRTLPPIMYPGKILNAAVNFYSHVDETGTP